MLRRVSEVGRVSWVSQGLDHVVLSWLVVWMRIWRVFLMRVQCPGELVGGRLVRVVAACLSCRFVLGLGSVTVGC